MASYKKSLTLLIVIIAVGVFLNSIVPLLYGHIIDLMTDKDISSVGIYLIIYLIMSIIISFLSVSEDKVAIRTGEKIECKLKEVLFDKIIRMRVRSQEQYSVGELMSRLESDLNSIISFVIEFITTIVYIALNFIMPLLLMFSINMRLSGLGILFLPASSIIYLAFKKRQCIIEEKRKKFGDHYYSFLNNAFHNINAIKAYQYEGNIIEKYKQHMDVSIELTKKKNSLDNTIAMSNETVNNVLGVAVLFLAGYLIVDGQMTIGLLVSFNIYIGKLYDSIKGMQKLKFNEQKVAIALQRLEELETAPQEDTLNQQPDNCSCWDVNCRIAVKNLFYSFGKNNVLMGVNINFPQCGLYSIVGKNGSGKTTLLRLLLKFYDCNHGDILIDGISYRSLSTSDVRNQITYVQKEPFILDDSFYNNIKMNTKITPDEAYDFCRTVGLEKYISSLHDGIDTRLGDTGIQLSSGMKQKLCIARALANKTRILILDEFTSDLDGEAEKEIVNVIKNISNSSIVISVSHRHYTVSKSDMIYILEDGVITAFGNYAELQKNNPTFQTLFRSIN